MGICRKKVTLFLAAFLLCIAVMFVCSGRSDADENTKTLFDKPVSLQNNQPDLSSSGLFFKMILMILVVVLLGAAAIYLSKKLLPKLNLPGKKIQVIETVHLGPRKTLNLIKIGTQTLLIGSTNENITKLADVTDQIPEADLPVNQIDNN